MPAFVGARYQLALWYWNHDLKKHVAVSSANHTIRKGVTNKKGKKNHTIFEVWFFELEKIIMIKSLKEQLDKINETLQKSNIVELSYIVGNKKEILKRNFIAGISRGIGIGIGVTIVTAIIVYILQKLILLNIPLIGDYIADIVAIVEQDTH